ncbi:hypothetical protein ANCCEY_13573 [Ancylostoma ceylanicum]|uniref:Potassium channel domain-containing protein n=1 Tax=Ancylostoma ceylanicum TaxID=53326 RepID=A0A0D6LIA1_9BILA|nr:hypothetical protein ANCCEY_13573 [Ancylostoma ceylanicum]
MLLECRDGHLRVSREADFAQLIAEQCLTQAQADPRLEWSFKSAALYGFGILTTLVFEKIEQHGAKDGKNRERGMAIRTRPNDPDDDTINGSTLFFIVILYLLLGALFIPMMHGQIDFLNGIYFAFICLTAIEYGDLVPDK